MERKPDYKVVDTVFERVDLESKQRAEEITSAEDKSPRKEPKMAGDSLFGKLISGALNLFVGLKDIFTLQTSMLYWRDIIAWFADWIEKHGTEKDVVGFTIHEDFEAGMYILVQGVFDKSRNAVEDARRIKAREVDPEVKANCFGKEKVTIFT